MLEDSVPSIWASVHGWYTPAVFFLLLNVVIGTIAVTSTRATSANGGPTDRTGKLTRLPSLVLDRIKSFNVPTYRSQTHETRQETLISRVPSLVLDRIKSFKLSPYRSQNQEALKIPPPPPAAAAPVEIQPPRPVDESHVSRSRSDTGEVLKKLPKKMKKSASAKSAFAHFELFEAEDAKTVEDRRPATSTVAPSAAEEGEEETGEVDARADVFINMFRNQLKLQRMDSVVRYEEMIKRGGNS